MEYRKDIQILRGLSVLIVVFFHVGIFGFHSGFLGVDIFFVISGFLMAVLYDENKKTEFFLRRAKRLLPAYFTVVLSVVLFSILLLTPNEYGQLIKQVWYANTFTSNIGYWTQSSYFSKSHFNPLLHLWSLGVEIQFYLIVPFVYLLFKSSRLVFICLFIGSLASCFFFVEISPKTSFYLLPFRVWEFLAGFGVAKLFTNAGNATIHKNGHVGGIAFIILLFAAALPIDGQSLGVFNGHPGVAALMVCSAVCLVLICGLPARFESSRAADILETLGKYSYSIYLVHFPLIVLILYQPFSGTILSSNSLSDTVMVFSGTAVGSWFLYHLVENRIRHKKLSASMFLVPPIAILLIAVSGSWGQSFLYSDKEMLVFSAAKDRDTYRCGKLSRLFDPSAISCMITANKVSRKSVLLIGNSHADAIKHVFSTVAENYQTDVHFMVVNDPLMGGGIEPEAILEDAVNKGVEQIVLHYSPGSINREQAAHFISMAKDKNIRVDYILPVPVWKSHIPEALWRSYNYNEKQPQQDLENYSESNQSEIQWINAMADKNLTVHQTAVYLCNPQCLLTSPEGTPYYFDTSHLTLTGSELLIPMIREILRSSESRKLSPVILTLITPELDT